MLQILYGTDWRSCDAAALDILCERVAQRRGGQVLVVPEQYSFEAERALCQRGGDTVSRYAEVLSFTRLATRACSVCGGVVTPVLDQGGRIMAMSQAVDQVRSRLKFYARSAAKADFLEQMLQAVDEFKCYGVDSGALRQAALRLEGSVAVKVEELSILLEGYEAVCAQGQLDPRDRLLRLRDHIRSGGYGGGQTLYVQGFAGFTAVELEILGAYLKRGAEITVCLCCDGLFDGEPVFAANRTTARQLMTVAERSGAAIRQQEIAPAAAHAACPAVLPAFCTQAEPPAQPMPLALREYDSPRREAEAVTAQILEQARQGTRYRDITVACADSPALRPALEAEFARYGIPANFSGKQSVLQTPELAAVLAALDAAAGGMEQEEMLRYLKSGFAPLDAAQADVLENYALTWSLSGSRWQGPWTLHPRGFGLPMQPEDAQLLARVNEAAAAAVEPVCALRRALQRAQNVGEQILALSGFLDRTGFAARLQARMERLQAAGALQQLQISQQLYETLLNALEQLYAMQARAVRTPEEFARLVRVLLAQYDVGAIPARLDGVLVADAAELQHNRAPHLYVLGCTDGCFPAARHGGSLLNETERTALRDAGVRLAPDENEQMDRVLIGSYMLLTGAGRSLWLSCSGGNPAYLFTRLAQLYPAAVSGADALPAELCTVQTLGACLAREARDGVPAPGAPQAAAKDAEALLRAGRYEFGTLDPATVQGLYGSTLKLSASKVDRFAACRFSFFLQYGLQARERRTASFDAPIYGTFVHAVLEQTGRAVMAEGGFHTVSPERLHAIAQQAMEAFLQTELDPAVLESQRFSYLLRRNFDEIHQVVDELGRELRQSLFAPAAFELRFARGGEMAPVEIQGQYARAELSGAVDRVDLFTQNGLTFVRVIDYKTGRKDFDYTDILEKMGLQMLIYLFALQQNGAQRFGTPLHPAGVLYVPARVELLPEPQKPAPEQLARDQAKRAGRKGLVLDDELLLQAMEPCGEAAPRYLPYKQGKSGRSGDLMELSQLQLLRDYVTDALRELTDALYSGQVAPNPYTRGSAAGACTFCPYASACHLELCGHEPRSLQATSAKEFWKRLEEKHHG